MSAGTSSMFDQITNLIRADERAKCVKELRDAQVQTKHAHLAEGYGRSASLLVQNARAVEGGQ